MLREIHNNAKFIVYQEFWWNVLQTILCVYEQNTSHECAMYMLILPYWQFSHRKHVIYKFYHSNKCNNTHKDRDKNDTDTKRRTMTKRQNIGHNEKKVYKTHHTLCAAEEEMEEDEVVDDKVSTENSQPLYLW